MPSVPKRTPAVTISDALGALCEQTLQRVCDGVRSRATLEMQQAHARWWGRTLGADLPLHLVDEHLLDELASRPRPQRPHERKPPGPATLRKRMSTLKGALELAHRRRWIARVPALPQILVPTPPAAPFLESYEDARRLFESLPLHRAEWYWVCLWTCQHPSDVERMVWADVDLRLSTVLIRNSKNRKPVVRVRMPAPLAKVLAAKWRRERPRPTDRIVRPWPSRKTTLPRHCRRLGLPEVNATQLRHTGLSWAARRLGITPALCAYAGHSSPQMMARRYAHALPAQLEEVTAALESMAAENDNGAKGGDPDQ